MWQRIFRLNGGLCALCVLRMMLGSGIINPLSMLPFLILCVCMDIPVGIRRFLTYMGGHSTNMWLVHTFFAYYLFPDFIYGLRYPLLMYVVLVLLSLLSSYVLHLVYNPLRKRVLSLI